LDPLAPQGEYGSFHANGRTYDLLWVSSKNGGITGLDDYLGDSGAFEWSSSVFFFFFPQFDLICFHFVLFLQLFVCLFVANPVSCQGWTSCGADPSCVNDCSALMVPTRTLWWVSVCVPFVSRRTIFDDHDAVIFFD
jgi:hypothetical protein